MPPGGGEFDYFLMLRIRDLERFNKLHAGEIIKLRGTADPHLLRIEGDHVDHRIAALSAPDPTQKRNTALLRGLS